MRYAPNRTILRVCGTLAVLGLTFFAGCDDDTTAPDTIAPGPTGDLAVAAANDSVVTLTWTATGDDGDEGRASRYELRYSTEPALEPDWLETQTGPYWGMPVPRAAGEAETLRFPVSQQASTYYFVLRAGDEVPNWAAFSRVCACTLRAPGPPIACFEITNEPEETGLPFDFDASCSSDPNDGDHELTYRWDWENDGTVDYVALGDPLARHAYVSGGTYEVVLVVEDTDAMRDTLIQSVSLANLYPQHSVAEVLTKLRLAYEYRDPVMMGDVLAADYAFGFSDLDLEDPDVPSNDISRAEEVRLHERMFSSELCQDLQIDFQYDLSSLEIDELLSAPEDTLWSITLTNADLFYYGGTPQHPDEPEAYEVRHSVNTLWFRRKWNQGSLGPPTYSVVLWREVTFGGGKSVPDVSWGQLKALFR